MLGGSVKTPELPAWASDNYLLNIDRKTNTDMKDLHAVFLRREPTRTLGDCALSRIEDEMENTRRSYGILY